MEKTLKYTLTLNGAFPEETLSGGIQGENKATAIIFEADSELQSKISFYKEQGKSVEAEILAVTEAGECVDKAKQTGDNLFSPFYLTDRVTLTGLDVIIVFKLLVDSEQKQICKAQIRLSFIPSPVFCDFEPENKSPAELLSKRAEEINAELEERADEITNTIEQKLEAVKTAASLTAQQLKTVKEIADKASETRLSLESGTEFVFLGGDALGNGGEAFLIDNELSSESGNPIANNAVANAIEEINQEISAVAGATQEANREISAVAGATQEANREISAVAGAVEEIKGEIQTVSQDITALQEREYIVEQGTSNIWTYRKWNSGIAECWCSLTPGETVNFYAEDGGALYKSNNFNAVLFPFSFVEAPRIMTAAVGAKGVEQKEVQTTTQMGPWYFWDSIGGQHEWPLAQFYVMGRWK